MHTPIRRCNKDQNWECDCTLVSETLSYSTGRAKRPATSCAALARLATACVIRQGDTKVSSTRRPEMRMLKMLSVSRVDREFELHKVGFSRRGLHMSYFFSPLKVSSQHCDALSVSSLRHRRLEQHTTSTRKRASPRVRCCPLPVPGTA